jgi:hypothetical protein
MGVPLRQGRTYPQRAALSKISQKPPSVHYGILERLPLALATDESNTSLYRLVVPVWAFMD